MAAEAADAQAGTVDRERRNDGVHARVVGQPRVNHRRGLVDPAADARHDAVDDAHQVKDLTINGTFTQEMAEFIRIAVLTRLNILISGGTGSGKTTLLNCLSNYIPADQRIITIEDAAELALQQPQVFRL